MRHLFLDLLRIGEIERQNLAEVLVEDDAARELELRRIADPVLRNIAVGHVAAQASAVFGPFRIERSDGQQVGNVQALDNLLRLNDEVVHHVQPLHVDGVVTLQIDRRRDAAHQIVRMRILAAENGVDLDDFLLPLEGFQIVRHRHQVRFRRKFVGRMTPIGVLENTQLAGFDELLQRSGDVGEITRCRGRPVRRDLLRQRRRGGRIGLERRHHIHPVQRVQMVEVNHMVLDILRQLHDVADDLRVLGDGDAQGVFHRAHRSERVNGGAHAADAFAECPGIARIAALQDHLEAAPHGAGRDGVADDAVVVQHGLNPQVAFNSSDGIDYYAFRHGSVTPSGLLRLPAVPAPAL